jgi:MFS family permease
MTLLQIWRGNFSPLRSAPVRLYLAGTGVSMLGNWLQQTAQALLVFKLSGGAAGALGTVVFCAGLPLILFSAFSGALADRFDRRRLLIACHVIEMLLACALALLTQAGHAQLAHIYLIAFLLGSVNSIHFPAQQALFFELTGLDQIRKLVSLNSMLLNVCRSAGPALAGYLVARYGSAVVFWQNAATYLAVIAVLAHLRGFGAAGPATTVKAGMGDALRHIGAHVQLRYAYFSCAVLTMFGLATLTLAPALAHGDPRGTGMILAAAGGGSLVYAFLLSPFVNRIDRMGRALSLSLMWMGGWLLVACYSDTPATRLLAMFMFGLATSMAMVGSTGMIQVLAPSAMRGRMMGMFSVIGFGAQPLAALATGLLADRIGAQCALGVSGTLAIASAGAMLSNPAWRGASLHGGAPEPLALPLPQKP